MGESYNLKTASSYVNNLLLARGLLRNGTPIEFAHPSRGQGGKDTTMAQIINLVHDLILKRDRDQEHCESLVGTFRTLRNESTRQTLALEKLHTRNDDLARQLSLAQSQERSARAALCTAESSARSLREEMLRLKTTVQQIRMSCANDIRKRDVQIQRLKTHLTSQQRGNKTGLMGASISIHPGAMGFHGGESSTREEALDTDDPEYSLRQETTEFLTQLSQSLSDENDNLIGLTRSTLVTLKELQGMPNTHSHAYGEGLSAIGEEEGNTRQGMLHALPTSYEALAADMDTVLEELKNLLTNPNFVSVDEVELREEEIVKLRAGWEQMERRWRDTLSVMDGWRKRMVNGGDTINLEELKMGLGLGHGLEAAVMDEVSMMSQEEDDEGASSVFDEEIDEADEMAEKSAGSDMFPLKRQPPQPALREATGNVASPARCPRKVALSASVASTPSQNENGKAGGSDMDIAAEASTLSEEARPWSGNDKRTRSPTKKRLSSPHAHPEEPWAKLTVQDKLKKAQAEAEAARVVEDLVDAEAKGAGYGGSLGVMGGVGAVGAVGAVEAMSAKQRRQPSSAVKTRIGGRAKKRRKSTLTPDELQNLLGLD